MHKGIIKTLRKGLCLLLCAVTLFSLVACTQQEQTGLDVPTTDTYLVKNGVSPYKILIPENASSQLSFAASDLQFFFQEATGVPLEITTQVSDVKGKYLSIGSTAIQQASGMSLTYDALGNDGYKLLTYGDAIVMAGVTDEASTYAVYGFLAKQFAFEYYANDVYEIQKTENAKLVDLDVTDVPDIAFRCGGSSNTWYGTVANMSRLRMRNMNDGWGLVTHTYFEILPPAQYIEAHPDWYDDQEAPLAICQTNEEMKAQFVENLKQIILDTPDCIYYMLGHEDGSPYCRCDDCMAVRAEYGGYNSALMMLFTNDVVRQINEWAAQEIPDRVLKFCTFAYTSTEEPPVEYSGDTIVPVNNDQKLMAEHNLGIMIAPIGHHISVPYMEGSAAGIFKGWAALTDNLYVWAYSAPFSNYMVPFDGFGSYKQNYQDYVEMGVEYVFEQGFLTYTPNFHELRGYLISKLLWDNSLDTETLVQDFMRNYYGPGWENIYEFYTLWRMRMLELREVGMESYCAAQLVQSWNQPDVYPKTLLDQYETLFDAALEANEALQETDPEAYIRYRDNIRAERCLIRYLELETYAQYYDYETYAAMIDEFADITGIKGVTLLEENRGKVSDLVAVWTEKLNSK